MIKARHSRMYDVFFNWYLHRILKKDFSRIDVVGSWPVHGQSVLVIGNHVSWWDGFWVYYLNKRFLKKKLHVMMLESQLKHRRFLTRIGAFSIEPGSVAQIIKKAGLQQVLFYVALPDYFSHRKPVLTLYLDAASVEGFSSEDLQEAYEQFHKQSLLLQAQKKE
ncbi:MAG: hypothetical protein LC643_07450 [Bacteroidales bacterium]|nr:hypothetical protein [Bacteroidales bacterium]